MPLLPLLLLLVGPAVCNPTSTPLPLGAAVHADRDHPEPGPAAAELDTAAVETDPALADLGTAAVETDPALAELDTATVETDPALAALGTAAAETDPALAEMDTAALETDPALADLGTAAVQAGPEVAGPQVSLTLHQIAGEMSRLWQATARAATAGPLSKLARTLTDLQASLEAVADRVDLVYASQLQQQERLDAVELSQAEDASRLSQLERSQLEATTRSEVIKRSQSQISSSVDAILQSQTEAASLHNATHETLDGLQQRQNQTTRRLAALRLSQSDLSSGVGERLDAMEASRDSLFSRVDTALEQMHQQTAAAVSSIQEQLYVIQADIRRLPILGRLCSSDTDCSRMMPEATCGVDSRCSCRDGYRRLSDFECRKNSRLSESCEEDADCQSLTPGSSCANGVCGCGEGFWTHNNTECRRIGAVSDGDPCVGGDDCDSSSGRRCLSGVCKCFVEEAGIYEYRLTGASSCKEGNVELRRNSGTWGLVCDDDWDDTDAVVVCRSLGFSSGSATEKSRFGSGTNFYMDSATCQGSESHLWECPSLAWGTHDCGAREVAGVICEN